MAPHACSRLSIKLVLPLRYGPTSATQRGVALRDSLIWPSLRGGCIGRRTTSHAISEGALLATLSAAGLGKTSQLWMSTRLERSAFPGEAPQLSRSARSAATKKRHPEG